jgi:REP element-mobilizing transposase RayT
MVNTYTSLNSHLVYSTKNREPWLIEVVRERLWPYLGGITRENGMKAPEIGGVADHVHIFVSVPATMALSKAMQLTKGGSSHWIRDFGRRYATRFAFGVVKPALKRGPTLDRRYRGKIKPVVEKALGWKRGPTLDCRYCGKVKLVIGQATLCYQLAGAASRS